MSEEEQLTRKRRLRAGHRASTTRILGQVEPAITADPIDVSKIIQLKRSLEDKLRSLSDLDQAILDLTPEDSIETEIIQADEIKERLYSALTKLDHCLSSPVLPHMKAAAATHPPATHPSNAEDEFHATDPPPSAVGPGPVQSVKVKLPKISLPRFNGRPVKWIPFWDSYESTIHSNHDLSSVDKFNYLRSLLDGVAFDAIAGLTLSSSNYQQAIDILHKHFGNKQVIVSNHMDILMNMDAVLSDRNLKDLRRLYDIAESHVRSLKSLGVEAASYGALLSPVILAKLPPDLRLIVSRRVSDSHLDMDLLLATFEEELTARERANPNPQFAKRSQERTHHTASTLLSSLRDPHADPRCSYCQQPHSSANCSSVTDVAARKQILKNSGDSGSLHKLSAGTQPGCCESRGCYRCV